MTWSEIVKIAKNRSGFLGAIKVAEVAAEFAEENGISPAMQEELEEAVRKGAEKGGKDPDYWMEYFAVGAPGET